MFAEGDWDDTASAECLTRSTIADSDLIKDKVSWKTNVMLSNVDVEFTHCSSELFNMGAPWTFLS